MEEEARGKKAGDGRDEHRDGDADTDGKEGERVKLHVSSILPPPGGTEVGPKVTSRLGRRREVTSTRIGTSTVVAKPPWKVLVVSGDPEVREGWARYFETRGSAVIRCAGPEATHCALAHGAHCPLLEDVDVAYYDNACINDDLAADLIKRPRLLPVFVANDKATHEGDHVPEVSRSI